MKLKLFAKGTVTEIHTETGEVIVSWMGFDDSATPLRVHRGHAAKIVRAVNAYPALLAALKSAERSLRYAGDMNKIQLREIANELRAAIASAEGKE